MRDIRATGENRSADPDAVGVSTAPIWIALVVGALLGLTVGGWSLLFSMLLALLVGFAIHARMQSRAEWRALRAAQARAELRLNELEFELALVKNALRSAAAARAPATAVDTPAASVQPSVPTGAAGGASAAIPESSVDVEPQTPLRPQPMSAAASWSTPVDATAATSTRAATPADARADPGQASGRALPRARTPAGAAVEPSPIERAFGAARDWLLGGNTVARIGLLVLFVGVAFLLRYVAERTQVPIELRLAGVAAVAAAFLGLGWRLRNSRPGFAVTLQGGAIGILYLTVFAALRLYDVIAPLPAFALMAVLAALSGLLSVLQNARALAALGATGGFVAPILISTGEGRIALLFSYYLLLNLGVLGIAWFRAWRELNWIAFAFTFGVSALWAVQRYTPAQFAIGQGFLAAFWLLFLVVSMLYALRQADRPRGLFDTTLVFALPLAAFGIQTRFAEPQAQGLDLALAAVVAAAAYLGASLWLLRRQLARGHREFKVLTEAHFGIGVALLTLAVPLAASAQWTAAAWSLEGLALLWVGLRQQRLLPLAAGLLLHVLGAGALALALSRSEVSVDPVLSGFTLNLAVLALAAFGSAWLLRRTLAADWGISTTLALERCAWTAQLVGWGWVAALAWQPLAFPGYVFAWCVLAVALVAADRRADSSGALAPAWVAGVAIVLFAAIATELRLPQYAGAGAGWAALLMRLAVAAASVAAALLSLRSGDTLRQTVAGALLTLGVIAWLVALIAEAAARIDTQLAIAQLALLLIAVTAVGLGELGLRLRWVWPQRLARTHFAAHVVLAAFVVAIALADAWLPSRDYGWAAWPVAWALFYLRLARDTRDEMPVPALGAVHVGGLWLLTAMLAAEVALRLDAIAGDGWFHAAWGAVLAAALWLTVKHALRWPLRAAPFAYAQVGVPGLALAALLWLLFANSSSGGDPAPLPALPLLNPLDLASLAAVGALLLWHLTDAREAWRQPARATVAAAAFFVVNTIALRGVHFIAGVDWSAAALGRSLLVQAVLSLLWSATAMGLMLAGHRRAQRTPWMAGAGLLAVVVAKLFFVDLSGQGTIERIVSFVGVGLLILVIGYLAPVPPTVRTDLAKEQAQ